MTPASSAAAQDLIPGVVTRDDVDWDRAQRVRFYVRQRFTYRYPAPISQLDQRLVVLPPAEAPARRRVGHHFQMDVAGTITEVEDAFGNAVLAIRVPYVEDAVSFETQFVVEHDRVPSGKPVLEGWLGDERLLAATPRTAAGPRVVQLVKEAAITGGHALAQAEAICSAVHSALAYSHDLTDVGTTAEEALAAGGGVCQDYAHVMIAACRALAIPARYISGHLVGDGGSHAWVEIVVRDGDDAALWAFDPTHDRVVGMTYVAVAAGRDYSDVAPTSGTYVGSPGGVLECARRMDICGVSYAGARNLSSANRLA
jgi:transglutaminase-like putative cysteine protease